MINQTSEKMKQKIKAGQQVLQIINQQNYDAYFVGGFVRDYMLQRFFQLDDIDIATNMPIECVLAEFSVVYKALKYGVVCIEYGGFQFEVAHFRKDGIYSDARHPDTVDFTETLLEDVKRRDFTINGLAMEKDFKVIDYVDGTGDLSNKIIRTIGDANQRFKEDSLRIIRALRFASNLSFTLDEMTIEAIYQNRVLITELPLSRIRQEFKKVTNKAEFLDYIDQFALDAYHQAFKETPNILSHERYEINTWDDYVFFQLYKSTNRLQTYRNLEIGHKKKRYYEALFSQIELYFLTGQNSWWNYQLDGQLDVFKFLAQIEKTPYNDYIARYQKEAIKTWEDISFEIIELHEIPNHLRASVKETIAYDVIHQKVKNQTMAIKHYIEEVYGWK